MVAIEYADRRIEKVCTDAKAMARAVDAATAKALKRRLAELEAAQTMADLLRGVGRWEQMTGDLRGEWSSRLSRNWRLIVAATDADSTDAVVVRLEDYH